MFHRSETHPEEQKLAMNRNQAIKRTKTLLSLMSKYGRKCWYCQTPFKSFHEVEVDHVVPRSRGGSSKMSNLAIACIPCNRAKGDRSLNEFLHWLMKPKQPVPVLYERAKVPEAQWRDFSEDIENGLRKVG